MGSRDLGRWTNGFTRFSLPCQGGPLLFGPGVCTKQCKLLGRPCFFTWERLNLEVQYAKVMCDGPAQEKL